MDNNEPKKWNFHTCVTLYSYTSTYVHDTYIPVNNQNWVNMSTSVRAHKLKQYIFLGVHVQPEQRMNTFEVPWFSYRQPSCFPTVLHQLLKFIFLINGFSVTARSSLPFPPDQYFWWIFDTFLTLYQWAPTIKWAETV